MEKTIKVLLDDFDGSEASRHIRFSVDGNNYELDVNDANGKAFDEALAPFIKVARKTGRFSVPAVSKPRMSSEELTRIRTWARAQGYKVSDRGRIAQTIQDAYYASK